MNRRAFFPCVLLPATARAHSYKLAEIKIGHAWALPTTLAEGQVFLPIANFGSETDALVTARSDICALIELRPYNRYDELPLQEFRLEPKKPLAMRPTSKHLRLIGLRKPLVLGESFRLVLDFLNAGEIEVEVHVEAAPGD